MPPKLRDPDRRLIAAYHEAALRLNRLLQSADPNTRRVLLRRIDMLLAELDRLTADYIAEALPLHFRDGSDEAIRQLKALRGLSGELDQTFGTIHKEAVQALAEDATLKFANALEGVKREARSVITRAAKEQVIQELITSEIEGANRPQDRVTEIFQQQGVTAFQGVRRKWTLEDYTAMLTHTVLAEAHNTGAATRYASNGVEYARRIEREDCCPICRPLRGKIVWMGDTRLLPPTHPWCYGGVEPFIGEPEDPIMSPDDPRIPEKTRSALLKKA